MEAADSCRDSDRSHGGQDAHDDFDGRFGLEGGNA